MPRTLPWLKAPATSSSSPRPPPPKRRRLSPTPASSSDELPGPHPSITRSVAATATPRSPSTSPAPVPPDTHLMRPGDEHWRLVLDEFEATAQLYSYHVHNAEYLRQKAAARERELQVGGAGQIVRPVVGGMSKEAERQMAVERQRRRVRKEVGEDETVDPWVGTQLAGLMMSPRKRLVLTARGVKTRAAAGFDRAVGLDGAKKKEKMKEKEDSTDDDLDLDVKTRPRSSDPQRRPTLVEKPQSRKPDRTSSDPPSTPKATAKKPVLKKESIFAAVKKGTTSDSVSVSVPISTSTSISPPRSRKGQPHQTPQPNKQHPKTIKTEQPSDPFTDFETGFPAIPRLPSTKSASSVLAKRREARLKREKEERERDKERGGKETEKTEKCQVHELPTFLF